MPCEHEETQACVAKELVSFNQRKLLWKIRPKHHYWVELLDYMYRSSLNPMSTSNFLDEDMMKAMRGVAKACHPKTVKHAWARRYLLKKVIAWSQGGKKKARPIAQVASHSQQTVMQRLLPYPIYHQRPFFIDPWVIVGGYKLKNGTHCLS